MSQEQQYKHELETLEGEIYLLEIRVKGLKARARAVKERIKEIHREKAEASYQYWEGGNGIKD